MARVLVSVAACALLLHAGTSQERVAATTDQLTPLRIVGLQYPRLALAADLQGRVELAAVISDQGAVIEASIISGEPLLADAARASLRQWQFQGCTPLGGRCAARLVFNFVLERGVCSSFSCQDEIELDGGTITIRAKRPHIAGPKIRAL
jgi:TonB family protein